MLRNILSILIIFITTNVYAQCGNPYCAMCNAMFGRSSMSYQQPSMVYSQQQPQIVQQPEIVRQSRPIKKIVVHPTPKVVVKEMLKMVNLTEKDVLYDLGCGDARILIEAARRHNCLAIGIEKDPHVAELARKNILDARVHDRAFVITGDAKWFNLDKATVVTMYLFPELMRELEPKIKNATRIVSYSHKIPNRKNHKVMIGKYPVYLWESNYDMFSTDWIKK